MKQKHLWWAALALLVSVNAATLAMVWYNRSALESQLPVSSRELRYASDFNYRLEWRTLEAFKLSAESLEALGLNLVTAKIQPREHRALIVLEFDGPAYQTHLARTQATLEQATIALNNAPDDRRLKDQLHVATRDFERALQNESRLYAIDAGPTLETLRQRYNNPQRYAILPGSVEQAHCDDEPICVRVSTITQSTLYPPSNHSLIGKKVYPLDNKGSSQLYLNIGQQLIPWLSLENTSP